MTESTRGFGQRSDGFRWDKFGALTDGDPFTMTSELLRIERGVDVAVKESVRDAIRVFGTVAS